MNRIAGYCEKCGNPVVWEDLNLSYSYPSQGLNGVISGAVIDGDRVINPGKYYHHGCKETETVQSETSDLKTKASAIVKEYDNFIIASKYYPPNSSLLERRVDIGSEAVELLRKIADE